MDVFLLGQVTEAVTASEGSGFSDLAPPIQVAIFLGALSFITSLLVSVTAFTRIVIVLSFIRRALATQEIPPNPVLLGLSLFLTMFVMAPTMDAIYKNAVDPFMKAQKTEDPSQQEGGTFEELWVNVSGELRTFMIAHTRSSDLNFFIDLSNRNEESEKVYLHDTIPLTILIPAFVISELKTAFIMGFCLYIPFLLIDLVVSAILMSLGMMMMPPVVVSTPCKLLLFVLVDGWQLITRALVESFNVMPT